MIRKWTVRAVHPLSHLPIRDHESRRAFLTFHGALTHASDLNSELTSRTPDDPIFRPERRYAPNRILRARIRLWRARRFQSRVAKRLRKVAP